MGGFEEKLESILNNPQAMSQIMSLAQSLGGTGSDQSDSASSEPPPPPPSSPELQLDPKLLTGLASLLSQNSGEDDQRIALLNALKPFVKEQRHAKIDKAIQIAKLSRMARMALELFRSEEDEHV